MTTEEKKMLDDVVRFILTEGNTSIPSLQRYFRIGYVHAGKIMDTLQMKGIVGPLDGTKPRPVLVKNFEEYEEKMNS